MMEFFPKFAGQMKDPRKKQITIRDLLQMRAGYPWEGRTPPYFDILHLRDNWHWLPHLVDFPLVNDPGLMMKAAEEMGIPPLQPIFRPDTE